MSTDPLERKYPYYSPYLFAGNNPILSIDLDGLEEKAANKPWVIDLTNIVRGVKKFFGVKNVTDTRKIGFQVGRFQKEVDRSGWEEVQTVNGNNATSPQTITTPGGSDPIRVSYTSNDKDWNETDPSSVRQGVDVKITTGSGQAVMMVHGAKMAKIANGEETQAEADRARGGTLGGTTDTPLTINVQTTGPNVDYTVHVEQYKTRSAWVKRFGFRRLDGTKKQDSS